MEDRLLTVDAVDYVCQFWELLKDPQILLKSLPFASDGDRWEGALRLLPP